VIADLIPGIYSVKIEMPGFKTHILNGVIIEAGGRKIAVDAVLKIGRAEEVVEVTVPLITIETEEPELGTTIEHAFIEELPIEMGQSIQSATNRGRRVDSFIFLTPGVTGGEFSHRLNGGVDFENEVTFNGLPLVKDETPGFQETINPPYEMVDEARVISSVFSPQYGLGQGVAAFQFASGTNELMALPLSSCATAPLMLRAPTRLSTQTETKSLRLITNTTSVSQWAVPFSFPKCTTARTRLSFTLILNGID
jgi:hypothetical protein